MTRVAGTGTGDLTALALWFKVIPLFGAWEEDGGLSAKRISAIVDQMGRLTRATGQTRRHGGHTIETATRVVSRGSRGLLEDDGARLAMTDVVALRTRAEGEAR